MSVGRLDIGTEGLLLLTNDGGLARVLELPDTQWLRRYRVRAHGRVVQAELDRLRDGISIEGVNYGPIEATLEREQGANVWLSLRHPRGQEPRGPQRARPSRPAGEPADPGRVRAVRARRVARRRDRRGRDGAAARAARRRHRPPGGLRFHQPHGRARDKAHGRANSAARNAARRAGWTGGGASARPRRGASGRMRGANAATHRVANAPHASVGSRPAASAPTRRGRQAGSPLSRTPRDDRPEKPPGRPRRGHAWRKDDAPLRRTYRGSRRDDLKIADEARPDKRAGLLKDRKGRRILVERFGTKKPKPEPAEKPARQRTSRPPPRDRAKGPRPSRPRPPPDRDR